MNEKYNDAVKARAEAAFHQVVEATLDPLAEYRARQDAERAKMAKLRIQRLAAEAMTAREKAKQ
jgi:hypothetical protein